MTPEDGSNETTSMPEKKREEEKNVISGVDCPPPAPDRGFLKITTVSMITTSPGAEDKELHIHQPETLTGDCRLQ